jgi:hypothetical protein
MTRVFSSPIVALLAGLCLRLLFIVKFPAGSGDTILYEQMATSWLERGIYAMNVGDHLQPVDLRMPGYPAYLTLIYWLTGKTGEAAHFAAMLGQAAVDLAACVIISLLAVALVAGAHQIRSVHRAGIVALWLAALCPFTANYVAVPLTETFAVFFTAAGCLALCLLVQFQIQRNERAPATRATRDPVTRLALLFGLLVGLATLFRPESPILLVAALLALAALLGKRRQFAAWFRMAACTALAGLLPLVPWAVRNFVSLHEVQLLAPKNSNLPGELVPYGFMAWEKTWLFRMKDCYLAPWKLNGEAIDVDLLPARAFDSPAEKQRVREILERYNAALTLTAEQDAAFGEIARERTARHRLRTYLWLPTLRALVMWFTPRIELLPVSGQVFPLARMWEDDKVDLMVTSGFFVLNLLLVLGGLWGAIKLYRLSESGRYLVLFIALFVFLRTLFLTTLETPEPRYVLECFPALLALAAVALTVPRRALSAPLGAPGES